VTTAWSAPPADRREPDRLAEERQALEEWVDFHRATLLGKCAGLTAAQLKERAVPPSRLSLLGLVRHMTDVERQWFRLHAGSEDIEYEYFHSEDNPDSDFEDLEDADAEAVLGLYQRELVAARASVASKALDEVVASRGHHPERTRNIRWIYLHMIEEYARHNGHADLIRQRIDGATGD
jgi:uncharacterized damage-inducible protein DinB